MSVSIWSWCNQTRHKWPCMVLSLVSHNSHSCCWPISRWPPNPIKAVHFARPCTPYGRNTRTTTCKKLLYSRSFSMSWWAPRAYRCSRTHRHRAQRPHTQLPNRFPNSKRWWVRILTPCTPNQCTVWVPTAAHLKKNASYVHTSAKNPNITSHEAAVENKRRTRTCAPTARSSIARSPIESNQTGACGIKKIQGLPLQIDLWQARSSIQTTQQILCRVRRVCKQG